MKTKILISVIIAIMLFGCNSVNEKAEKSNDEYIALKMKEDSIKREKEKQLEIEMLSLKEQGFFGRWECAFSGYESIISFRQEGNTYFSIIDFTKSNSKTKNETLQKKDEKYFVLGSKAKEYYVINKDGNLEMWDKDGLFTTSRNIMPNVKSKPIPEFDIDNVIGQNIFSVIGNYSKSSPETLDGTNNEYWIVYYSDIDATFKVKKSTDKIQKTMTGKVPNMN